MRLILTILFASLLSFSESKGVEQFFSDLSLVKRDFLEGKLKKAMDSYRKLFTADSTNWIYSHNIGVLSLQNDDTSSAIKFFEKSFELNPDEYWSAMQLCRIYQNKDNFVESGVYLNHCLSSAGTEPHVSILHINHLVNSNRFEFAIERGNEVLEEYPNYAELRSKLIELNLINADTTLALELLEKGLKRYPAEELLRLESVLSTNKNLGLNLDNNLSQLDSVSSISKARLDISSWVERDIKYNYKAKWGPFTLGTIDVTITDAIDSNSNCIMMRFDVKNNPHLPVISVDTKSISYINSFTGEIERFLYHVRDNWDSYDYVCDLDSATDLYTKRFIDTNGRIEIEEFVNPKGMADGTSLLFHARKMVREKRNAVIPTLIHPFRVVTILEYEDRREYVEILDSGVDAWVITGYADYPGIAGLSGSFKGWFSTDNQAIPYRAAFKIFIGSIRITLDSIDRF